MVPDHFFRHEHGRLVSLLSRRFGAQSLELCEDAAQVALLRALENWTRAGVPDEPGAWLYRVAHHHLLDVLRAQRRRAPGVEEERVEPAAVYLASEVPDDLLRMMFLCADPELPYESQLALALKTLCGFSTDEIALRLFQTTEAIHKRLQRARARLRERELDIAPDEGRVPSILQMLYLLFSEGYSSAKPDSVIRRELCDEAIRLTCVLAEHPLGAIPETDALLALMYLHASRFDARLDSVGGLLLLREQDRSRWDRSLIEAGVQCLARSARGDRFSRYHAEAAIAAEHCLAPTYERTPWAEITRLYEALDRVAPSPLNRLNRAIAIAEWKGAEAAIAALSSCIPLDYYLWDATLGALRAKSDFGGCERRVGEVELDVARVAGHHGGRGEPRELARVRWAGVEQHQVVVAIRAIFARCEHHPGIFVQDADVPVDEINRRGVVEVLPRIDFGKQLADGIEEADVRVRCRGLLPLEAVAEEARAAIDELEAVGAVHPRERRDRRLADVDNLSRANAL